jgi:endonuclease/exonuclease/phosphatase family metal-dependent hydrolase
MSDGNELRVMTYNVRSLRDDVDALAGVVRGCAPDVVLVQEAPRFLRWRSKRAALARHCGLVVATADRPGGLCVLTALRVDVLGTSFVRLSPARGHHQRVVVAAAVRRGSVPWRVASVHLSTDAAERRRHLPELTAALSVPGGGPLVVAGDLNEGPDGTVFTTLAGRMQDCFAKAGTGDGSTSPAAAPRRRLDAIFVDAGVTVASCEVVDGAGVAAASDHRPVLAVLRQ